MNNYFGLQGRTALVTGAARGIGRAIATTLSACGATVIVSDRDAADCEAVAAELRAGGGTAFGIAMDIGSSEAIEEGFSEVARLLDGQLDILVNNAGMMCVVPVFEDRMDIWDRTYAVNVRGTFICSREAARMMKAGGTGGRIINISSSAAVRAVLEGVAPYSSSKGAVNSMSLSLAYDLAPDNITVNVVMPHAIVHPDVAKQYAENETPVSGGAALDPSRYRMPRQGEPQDIASLVAFLAGPGAAYITGQIIAVDGAYLTA